MKLPGQYDSAPQLLIDIPEAVGTSFLPSLERLTSSKKRNTSCCLAFFSATDKAAWVDN